MKGYSLKQFIDEYQLLQRDLYCEVNLEELLCHARIVIIRSAKEQVLTDFLDRISNAQYMGKILLIGREGDNVYSNRYNELDMEVYCVQNDEKYQADKLESIIREYAPDAICMLYQNTISLNHMNLFEILSLVRCERYAISNRTSVTKLNALKKYICGTKIYPELCNWMSLELED